MLAANLLAALVVNALFGGDTAEATGSDGYKLFSFSLSGGVILVFTLLFLKIEGRGIKETVGIKLPDKKYWFVALGIFVGMTFGLGRINGYFIEFLQNSCGYVYKPASLPTLTPLNFVLTVICVCVLPAVAEEACFRGVMLSGLKGSGRIFAAAMNGLLFALYHMNPAQTPYQFAVGFIFALAAWESGSAVLTAAVHFVNNLFVITVEYFFGGELSLGKVGDAVAFVVGIICLAASLCFLLYKKSEKKELAEKWLFAREFIKYAFIGTIVCGVIWAARLFL